MAGRQPQGMGSPGNQDWPLPLKAEGESVVCANEPLRRTLYPAVGVASRRIGSTRPPLPCSALHTNIPLQGRQAPCTMSYPTECIKVLEQSHCRGLKICMWCTLPTASVPQWRHSPTPAWGGNGGGAAPGLAWGIPAPWTFNPAHHFTPSLVVTCILSSPHCGSLDLGTGYGFSDPSARC